MSYIDNDDDLFDYDPEEESSSPETYSPTSHKSVDNFLSDTKNLLEDIVLSDDADTVDQKKVKLILGFHQATHLYFSRQEQPAFLESISMTLDKLTNGDFSMLHMFHTKEALIFQRMKFIALIQAMLTPSESDNISPLADLMKALQIDYTNNHIDIFYNTSLNISRHCLNVDRIIYSELAKKLNLSTKDYLFDDTYLNDPIAFTDNINSIQHVGYQDSAYAAITAMLGNDSVVQKLSETFSTQVSLFDNFHEK